MAVVLSCHLAALGISLFNQAQTKSPAAISRFLNEQSWCLRRVIRAMREHALQTFEAYLRGRRGRPPMIEIIVDQKFPALTNGRTRRRAEGTNPEKDRSQAGLLGFIALERPQHTSTSSVLASLWRLSLEQSGAQPFGGRSQGLNNQLERLEGERRFSRL